MANGKVTKAIFPVAGLGTRFLPATKAIPKETLTLVDRPLIQYAVDEALASGIEQLIFVTSRGKSNLEDYFDRSPELERTLAKAGKKDLLRIVESCTLDSGAVTYVRQNQALGLGHAIACASHLINDEPFAVILPDVIVDAAPGAPVVPVATLEARLRSLAPLGLPLQLQPGDGVVAARAHEVDEADRRHGDAAARVARLVELDVEHVVGGHAHTSTAATIGTSAHADQNSADSASSVSRESRTSPMSDSSTSVSASGARSIDSTTASAVRWSRRRWCTASSRMLSTSSASTTSTASSHSP